MTDQSARWVRVSVEMLAHDVFDNEPFDKRSAWLWLIANAAWKDRRVNHKGKSVELRRGEVLIGRAHLAKVWGWGEQQVRTFLDVLKKERMLFVNQSRGHYANVATICNYEKYQSAQEYDNQSRNQSPTRAQPELNQTFTNTTNSTTYISEHSAAPREASEPPKVDIATLHVRLNKSAGEAMRANSAGVHDISPIIGCLEAGADLERDVLPTIARICSGKRGVYSNWSYFVNAIVDTRARRLNAGAQVAKVAENSAAADLKRFQAIVGTAMPFEVRA